MTSEYVLSWLDPDRDQGIDGKYFWIEEPYQTQRSCAEALLAKPNDRSHYVNGTSMSHATAQGALNYLDHLKQQQRSELERQARLEQARLEAVAARLKSIFGPPTAGLPEQFWLEVAAKVVESYNSVEEV